MKSEKWKKKNEVKKKLLMVNILYDILSIFSFFSNDHKKSIMCKNDGQKSDSNDNKTNASNNAI